MIKERENSTKKSGKRKCIKKLIFCFIFILSQFPCFAKRVLVTRSDKVDIMLNKEITLIESSELTISVKFDSFYVFGSESEFRLGGKLYAKDIQGQKSEFEFMIKLPGNGWGTLKYNENAIVTIENPVYIMPYTFNDYVTLKDIDNDGIEEYIFCIKGSIGYFITSPSKDFRWEAEKSLIALQNIKEGFKVRFCEDLYEEAADYYTDVLTVLFNLGETGTDIHTITYNSSYPSDSEMNIMIYTLTDENEYDFTANGKSELKGKLNDDRVRLREGPGTDTTSLGVFPIGEEFIILNFTQIYQEIDGIYKPWVRVKLNNGTIGYFYGQYVERIN